MILGINPNGDIDQKQAKSAVGVPSARPTTGRNYANSVNQRAKARLAEFRVNARIKDMLEAIGRVQWGNVPVGLRSKQIERILYYRGQGMWYWDNTLEKYFFLPYGLTSENNNAIDFYGQYQYVKPYPFNGKSESNVKSDGKKTSQDVYLGTIVRQPVYDMEELEAHIASKGEEWCKNNLCVLVRDYTQQLSEYCIPRSIAQEPYIDFQTEVLPMLRTMLLKTAMPTLVTGEQGTVDSIMFELQSIENSIILGKPMIPVAGFQEMQEITQGSTETARAIESFLKVYQSLDNIRKDNLGVPNDGMFQKNAHMLETEQDIKETSSGVIIQDALDNRQMACDLINRLWGLQLYCDESEGVSDEHADKEEEREEGIMSEMNEEDDKEEVLQI